MDWANIINAIGVIIVAYFTYNQYTKNKITDYKLEKWKEEDKVKNKRRIDNGMIVYGELWDLLYSLKADRVYIIQPYPLGHEETLSIYFEVKRKWAEPMKTEAWQKEIEAWQEEHPLQCKASKMLNPQTIMEDISEVFGEATYVTDVGQHQMWATQFLKLKGNSKLITSGGLGTMGFGFPASLGAKEADHDRQVVCLTGDGGFQMNMQELATSICADIPVTICLFNNRYLGMVRQQQQYFYGKRYQLTYLGKRPAGVEHPDRIENADELYVPDYLKLVDSYGIKGIRVEDEAEIVPALEEAKKAQQDGKSMLIEFEIAPEDVVLPMVKGGMANSDMILK